MKVLALAHQYVPVRCAGAETMLHAMLRALAARGHDVNVSLSIQRGNPYVHDGVKVWPFVDKRDVFRLLPADVLVGHLENTHRTMFLGEYNNIPTAVVHHNTMYITKEALTIAQARIDLVAVNSQWMADDLTQWLRDRRARQPWTVVVRPTVNPADYSADGPHDRVTLVNLRKYEAGGTGGRTMMGKGAETFWALAERMPNTKFLGVKGAYGTQLVRDLPNVEVLEHMPNHEMRDKVFARTRVLLMPSSYESWGRVATEALCSGIPVIASPTPGLRENLGPAGFYVDWRDVDGYCRILRTLAMPRPYEAARRRALTRAAELDPQEDLDRWCDAVEHIAARRLVGV